MPIAPPSGQKRWPKSARRKRLRLNTAGWVDQDRGIVRLPIETAMQIYEQAAQNPDAARADLIARAGKAPRRSPSNRAQTQAI